MVSRPHLNIGPKILNPVNTLTSLTHSLILFPAPLSITSRYSSTNMDACPLDVGKILHTDHPQPLGVTSVNCWKAWVANIYLLLDLFLHDRTLPAQGTLESKIWGFEALKCSPWRRHRLVSPCTSNQKNGHRTRQYMPNVGSSDSQSWNRSFLQCFATDHHVDARSLQTTISDLIDPAACNCHSFL